MISLAPDKAREILATATVVDGVYRFADGRLAAPSLLRDAGLNADDQAAAWSAEWDARKAASKRIPRDILRPNDGRARVTLGKKETRTPAGSARGATTMSDTTEANRPNFSKDRLAGYTKGKTGALNNGDAVAQAMDEAVSGADKGEARSQIVHDIAEANGLDLSEKSYPNFGMLRMAVGTMLRARVKNGATVKIGKTRIDAAALGVEVREQKAKAPAATQNPASKVKAPAPKAAAAPAKAPTKAAPAPAAKGKTKGK